jgi:hypothetical protein
MPLRNHFANPDHPTWDRVHGGWPMLMVMQLFQILPPRYRAAPTVHPGQRIEIDVGTFDREPDFGPSQESSLTSGSAAVLSPPQPTVIFETDPLDPDQYEVRIYDTIDGSERLVAAIELVSPSNKDRPSTRQDFVAKCAGLIQHEVCVSIIDLVTPRRFNLYADLLEHLGHTTPILPTDSYLYAATIHRRNGSRKWRLHNWAYELQIGQPLPSLPIWLNERDGIMLDLETTYEDTCRTLRLA